MNFTGINTNTYTYTPAVNPAFNGMLIYYRRADTNAIDYDLLKFTNTLTGTLYRNGETCKSRSSQPSTSSSSSTRSMWSRLRRLP